MPSPRKFSVTLFPTSPASVSGMITIHYSLRPGEKKPTHSFEAPNTAGMLAEVQRFAKEHGKPCFASVSIVDGGRKPSGFDQARGDLFFNGDTDAEANSERAA
jgi:hypothetical protein